MKKTIIQTVRDSAIAIHSVSNSVKAFVRNSVGKSVLYPVRNFSKEKLK